MNTDRRNWVNSVSDLTKVARDQVVEIKREEEKELQSLIGSPGVGGEIGHRRETVAVLGDVISFYDEAIEALQGLADA